MKPIVIIALREIREGLRNRRVLATASLLAGLALTLALLGSAPTGNVGASRLAVTVVSLSSLTIFLVPLIALVLTHDTIAGELDRGTMVLLLSYPLARWQVVIGKFAGHVVMLGLATAVAYGAAGLALWLGAAGDDAAVAAFCTLIGTSILLGAAFVATGTLVSTLARDPRTAAGIALGVWLASVLLYDMALLGLLIADQGRTLRAPLVQALLVANPTDAYRLLNLTGLPEVGQFAGLSGLAGHLAVAPATLLAALGLWVAAPLAASVAVFARRQV